MTEVGNKGNCKDRRGKRERKESIEQKYSKNKEPDIISNSNDVSILDSSNEIDTTDKNTVWYQIRHGLREELGDHIDQAWFAKAEAIECKDTKTLTLTMPTRFMADWIRNNYSHVIRRLTGCIGVKSVKYNYE